MLPAACFMTQLAIYQNSINCQLHALCMKQMLAFSLQQGTRFVCCRGVTQHKGSMGTADTAC